MTGEIESLSHKQIIRAINRALWNLKLIEAPESFEGAGEQFFDELYRQGVTLSMDIVEYKVDDPSASWNLPK